MTAPAARKMAEEALARWEDHRTIFVGIEPQLAEDLADSVRALLAAEPATERETRLEAAYQREHARLTEVLGALSEVLPPGAEIRPALLALKARAEASGPAKGAEDGRITHHAATGSVTGPIRGVVEDVADISARLAAAESRAERLLTALKHLLKAFLMLHRACGTGSAEQWPEVEDARAALAAEEGK